MSLSPIRNSPSAFQQIPTQDLSVSQAPASSPSAASRCGNASGGLPGFFVDSFETGNSRGAQLDMLLEGTKAAFSAIQALQQLVEAVLPAVQGQGASPLSDVFSGGGAAGGGAVGGDAAGGGAAGGGAAGGGAAGGAPGGSPVAPSPSSPVSIEGDARLGAGTPDALGKYKGAIESAAAKTGVPASMLAAQIWQESRGNLSATSTNGGNGLTDTGLMQVNPNTYKELQAKYPELQGKDLADPETNILAGAYYMKDMKEQFGSWDLALRAYNSGPNGVDRSNPHAIPAGTGDATYVEKVQRFANIIATGNGTLPA